MDTTVAGNDCIINDSEIPAWYTIPARNYYNGDLVISTDLQDVDWTTVNKAVVQNSGSIFTEMRSDLCFEADNNPSVEIRRWRQREAALFVEKQEGRRERGHPHTWYQQLTRCQDQEWSRQIWKAADSYMVHGNDDILRHWNPDWREIHRSGGRQNSWNFSPLFNPAANVAGSEAQTPPQTPPPQPPSLTEARRRGQGKGANGSAKYKE
jgi:hypothetical protein